ncbi:N-carbamoyl-L-amino-acid hydrolase [Methylobacterium sp. UNC300MFChir4.1]|uniref:allantoate amidohydrolase n=1 Tax=Methylobacterium sp. UNC300MFChir4.1 TaxID=1502747 RepID=UPI0008BCD9D4|nr:allantoate amidohydrolase [Methylobacterium sp. UNC300MFChir4.1]SEO70646.1 N-carbamoyl-L-amino-acid hydrolase [Methylobacterium sp. UNC300MFChir4.1]
MDRTVNRTNLPLSRERLWDSLMELARIGALPNGGNDRQALTDRDAEGRALFQRWGEAAGLTLTVDRVGTMVFHRPGRDPGRKPVAVGSHLDTQPTGGKFDGPLGVLAGLEIMRALQEAGIETEAPLLLINWCNEEGARFAPPMSGSGVAMGIVPEADILATRDLAGHAFGDELRRIGWQGTADPAALREIGAYFELHIEQGKRLEEAGLTVGVVDRALAQIWYEITVLGEEAHAGSPMAGRRDAMMAAAALIASLEGIAQAAVGAGGERGRATVGVLRAEPASRNITPGRVWFSLDTRHGDTAQLEAMGARIRARADALAAARGVTVQVAEFWRAPPTPFDPVLVDRVQAAAEARGHAWTRMPTAIYHDAVYCARAVPAALVFCPCHGGISHNEAESITPAWAGAGLEVLADAVLATAGLVGPRTGPE